MGVDRSVAGRRRHGSDATGRARAEASQISATPAAGRAEAGGLSHWATACVHGDGTGGARARDHRFLPPEAFFFFRPSSDEPGSLPSSLAAISEMSSSPPTSPSSLFESASCARRQRSWHSAEIGTHAVGVRLGLFGREIGRVGLEGLLLFLGRLAVRAGGRALQEAPAALLEEPTAVRLAGEGSGRTRRRHR